MELLGYHHHHGFDPHAADAYIRGDVAEINRLLQEFQSFDDWPWPAMYKQIAEQFPDAKFVLTRRADATIWLRSYRRHCETFFPRVPIGRYHRSFVGASYPHGQSEAHVQAYLQHIDEVRSFFSGQPDRLLEVCFETDPVLEMLARFLNCDVPPHPVPHANEGWSGIRWRRSTKRLILEILGRLERLRGITPTPNNDAVIRRWHASPTRQAIRHAAAAIGVVALLAATALQTSPTTEIGLEEDRKHDVDRARPRS
jgi:hypothetical protein